MLIFTLTLLNLLTNQSPSVAGVNNPLPLLPASVAPKSPLSITIAASARVTPVSIYVLPPYLKYASARSPCSVSTTLTT